ncbi:hypothetical protein BX600DRAFT_439527 [Xylariales sp. PMI_506]|nr:hypothetical protein BX600DRAFT_439527 [Xylariales sp. PMI_506]
MVCGERLSIQLFRVFDAPKDIMSTSHAVDNRVVLALGLPRCGTSSLKAAFESKWLDLKPVHHMSEVMPDGSNRKLVFEAAQEQDREKRQKLLAKLLRGYTVVTDLLDMYPDAKIILNHRNDGTTWAKSVYDSIHFVQTKPFFVIIMWFKLGRGAHYLMTTIWKVASNQLNKPDPYFGADPTFGPLEFYDAWQEHIRTEAKKRSRPLLEWQPQDGWKPLFSACRYKLVYIFTSAIALGMGFSVLRRPAFAKRDNPFKSNDVVVSY